MTEKDYIKIYNEDCLVGMRDLPDKSIDMILADLPYGVTNNKKDVIIPFEPLWREYERVIKDNGAICLFAQGLFYVDLVNSNRKLFRYDLAWNKVLTTGFLNANRMPLRQHETIAVFYKRLPTYNPQFTDGKPLHGKGTAYLHKEHKNENYGDFEQLEDTRKGSTEKYPTSILKFAKPHPASALHRTEKPVELLEWLINTYTNENEIVLDNVMGSGSTGVACININRRFIGYEICRDTFEVAKERIEKVYRNRDE